MRHFMMSASAVLFAAMAGCAGDGPTPTEWDDADGDGFLAGIDCDEDDPDIHPGADGDCDGVDQDCDGVVDEGCDTETTDPVDDTGSVTDDTGLTDTGPTGPTREFGPLDADHQLASTMVGAGFGAVVGLPGDLDGDGNEDVLVAGGNNVAFLFQGPIDPAASVDIATATQFAADAPITAIAPAGDLDGDGFGDVLFGASRAGVAELPYKPGVTYVVRGGQPYGGVNDLAQSLAVLVGESDEDDAGITVDGLGDFNGDGADDLLIGAPNEDSAEGAAGAAYVVYGPISGEVALADAELKLLGERRSHFSGHSVASCDANGDGSPDLIIGSPGEALEEGYELGASYLVLGPVSGQVSLSASDAKRHGEVSAERAGTAVAAPGDITGDGLDDYVVGSPFVKESPTVVDLGAVYVVSGDERDTEPLSNSAVRIYGGTPGEQAGFSITGMGDFDGDGRADFAVGAPGVGDGSKNGGGVYLIAAADIADGGALLLDDIATRSFDGAIGDALGVSVAGGRDLDGDGWPDLIAGAPGYSQEAVGGGAVYFFFNGAE